MKLDGGLPTDLTTAAAAARAVEADGYDLQAYSKGRLNLGLGSSTPAYRPVLEHHGIGDLQTEANRLSKQGEWVAMGDLIDDEVLSLFAVIGEERAAVIIGVRVATGDAKLTDAATTKGTDS
jgi:hypothetical protein